MRLIGYVQVTTDEQARSGLGMDAHRTRIAAEMERRGWPVEWLTDDGYSAKDLNRPTSPRRCDDSTLAWQMGSWSRSWTDSRDRSWTSPG